LDVFERNSLTDIKGDDTIDGLKKRVILCGKNNVFGRIGEVCADDIRRKKHVGRHKTNAEAWRQKGFNGISGGRLPATT
jgi:hypothetical protein